MSRQKGSRENIEDKLREGFQRYKNNFKKIADIEIFDGCRMYIYKNLNSVK